MPFSRYANWVQWLAVSDGVPDPQEMERFKGQIQNHNMHLQTVAATSKQK